MILAQSKHNKLIWHSVISHQGENRLLCRPSLRIKSNTIRDYSPKLLMCVDCNEKLRWLDPKWKLELAKLADNKKDQEKQDFDHVVQSLIKSRRY